MTEFAVPLSQPIKGHGGVLVSEIVLRQPNGWEVVEIGNPYFIAVTPGEHVPFEVENPEAIKAYLKRCIVKPDDPELFMQLKPRDVLNVKEKLLSFFHSDAPASAT